ncbi:MAG TPA: hypothetical protein VGH33_10460 [Isosphaeraceae bacterium]|jgi:hypothetical protein
MIKRFILAISIVSACAIAGCSGSNAGPGAEAGGPHGGVFVSLPGEAGVAEILTEEEAAAKGQRQRGRTPKSVVVYFLGPDKKTALSPLPTAVGVKFLGADSVPAITLGPAPDSKDPSGAGRFASPVGDYDLSGRRAELTADLGGQKVAQEFAGPR